MSDPNHRSYPLGREPFDQRNKIWPGRPSNRRLIIVLASMMSVMLVIIVILATIVIHMGTTAAPHSSPQQTSVSQKTVIASSSPQAATPTPIPTAIPTPTPTATPINYAPGTVICHPSWANGLQGWSATSDWFIQDGQLLNNGQGSAGAPTLIPPCQSKLAGVRDYALVVTLQILQLHVGQMDFDIRGTISNGSWSGYSFLINTGGDTYDANLAIDGGTQGNGINDYLSGNIDAYRISAQAYHITSAINNQGKISIDDFAHLTGDDIGISNSGCLIRIFDIQIIAL